MVSTSCCERHTKVKKKATPVPPGHWRKGECLLAQRSAPPSASPGSELSLGPEQTQHRPTMNLWYNTDFLILGCMLLKLLINWFTETNLAKLLCVGASEQRVEYNNSLIQIPQKNALKQQERIILHCILKIISSIYFMFCNWQEKIVCVCNGYLQVTLSRWGAIRLLALPLGFADRVPASDLVLVSGSSRESHTGRKSRACREALWWRRI